MTRSSAGRIRSDLGRLFEAGVGVDDSHLLARFAATCDEASFAALVARHGPMVLATARAVLRHEQDAEDAFQATFLTLARRAGSVRAGATLGAWLHRVAHRSALAALAAARLRQQRQLAAAPDLVAQAWDRAGDRRSDPDAMAAVHAEVERLPEAHRLAVVLVDLEGLGYHEAAARLGWTEPTLRNRLADARRRLRGRLTRRGLAPTGGVALSGWPPFALPLVPESLARRATLGALGGSSVAAASVREIVRTLGRDTLMRRLAAASLVTLTATVLGTVGWLARSGPAPAQEPAALAQPADPPALVSNLPGDAMIRGRVIDPTGRPVAGAEVRTVLNFNHPAPRTVATTGTDGTFALPAPIGLRQEVGTASNRRALLASAPGFGPGWTVDSLRPDVVIRLVPPGPPIEGHLLDAEGKALAGATVRFRLLFAPITTTTPEFESPNLDAYFAAGSDRPFHDGLRTLLVERSTTADANGRFRFADLGANRIAELAVEHPAARRSTFYAATIAALPPGTVPSRALVSTADRKAILLPARFERRSEPTRPITGVISDHATGRPLAGWKIQGADDPMDAHQFLYTTTTDAAGRYTLSGLGVVGTYRIMLTPPPGKPYLPAEFESIKATGAGSLTFDHAARRGVVVRGRVLDGVTGQPVTGSVNTDTFLANPNLKDYAGYASSQRVYHDTDAEGRYEAIVPPGRAIVAFRARDEDRYPIGQGETIVNYDFQTHRRLTINDLPYSSNYHMVATTEIPVGAESAALDLRVMPARTVNLTILDPEGRPIRALEVEGRSDFGRNSPVDLVGPTVAVQAALPGKPRRVIVRERARKLVGTILLRDTDREVSPLLLGPWGEVRGRIVDDAGQPRQRISLAAGGSDPDGHPTPEPSGIFPGGSMGDGVSTDASARFTIVGLAPGLHYAASANDLNDYGSRIGGLFDDLTVEPGQVRDLGDLKIRPLPNR